jgi:hypothetical protein
VTTPVNEPELTMTLAVAAPKRVKVVPAAPLTSDTYADALTMLLEPDHVTVIAWPA